MIETLIDSEIEPNIKESVIDIKKNKQKKGILSELYFNNMNTIAERAQKMPGLLSAMAVIFTVPMIFIVAFGPYLQDLMELFG